MTFPWITRSSHEAMILLVTTQLAELKQERQILLDRLASLGLGGPLFHIPVNEEEAPELTELEALEQQMQSFRRRPSKLADALTRKARRERAQTGPSVQWIPKVDAVNTALDQAEALGKIQA